MPDRQRRQRSDQSPLCGQGTSQWVPFLAQEPYQQVLADGAGNSTRFHFIILMAVNFDTAPYLS